MVNIMLVCSAGMSTSLLVNGVPSGKCGFTTLSPFSRRFPHF
ncbi:hypothetical protein V7146_19525 [Gottfriedia acidiceleris]